MNDHVAASGGQRRGDHASDAIIIIRLYIISIIGVRFSIEPAAFLWLVLLPDFKRDVGLAIVDPAAEPSRFVYQC
jgi:hypothetical protein